MEQKINQIKYFKINPIGWTLSILGIIQFLIPIDILDYKVKIIILISSFISSFIVQTIIYIYCNRKFYKKYEQQYNYFINKLDKLNLHDNKISNVEQEIQNIKENSLHFDTVEEWEEDK